MVGNHSFTLFVQAEADNAFLRVCCEPLWLLETWTFHLAAWSSHWLLPPTASFWLGYRHAVLWAAAAPAQERHRHISSYLMSCLQLWFHYSYSLLIFSQQWGYLQSITLFMDIWKLYWNQYNFVEVPRSAQRESKDTHCRMSPVLNIRSS